jgi:hypothetical protein
LLLTLKQLREQTLEWLGDPIGETFNADRQYTRLDGLINKAYQDVVDLIDDSRKPWALSREDVHGTLTVVTTQREYPLVYSEEAFSPRFTSTVRRIIDVHEVSGRDKIPLDIVSYDQRNWGRPGVYAFQSTTTVDGAVLGAWFLGLCAFPPVYTTLLVHAAFQPTKLSNENDMPHAVSQAFHELIYFRAALLGRAQEGRDTDTALRFWLEGRAKLEAALDKPYEPFVSKRLG